jgi:hypothetical protein
MYAGGGARPLGKFHPYTGVGGVGRIYTGGGSAPSAYTGKIGALKQVHL